MFEKKTHENSCRIDIIRSQQGNKKIRQRKAIANYVVKYSFNCLPVQPTSFKQMKKP